MNTTFFAISGLINCAVSIISGVVILFYNFKNKINRIYFLFALATSFWSFNYWMWLSSDSPESALIWAKIMGISTIIIPVIYFHLVVEMMEIGRSKNFLVGSAYAIVAIVALFSPLDFFVQGVAQKLFFPHWPVPGPLYHFVFALIYTPLVAYSFVLIAYNYQYSMGDKKAQTLFLLIGSILGWLGGLTNFFLFYDLPIPPYGNFIIPVYTLFIGYSIMKSRFFQKKLIIGEMFVFLIWVWLALKTNFFVLIGAIIVGIFLLYIITPKEKKLKNGIIK